mgnify:CR=1 FL=1
MVAIARAPGDKQTVDDRKNGRPLFNEEYALADAQTELWTLMNVSFSLGHGLATEKWRTAGSGQIRSGVGLKPMGVSPVNGAEFL